MPKILESVGLKLVSENRQDGSILAQRGMTMWSCGENVAIFITALDTQKTRIEIISKKVLATNLFVPNWSVKLFQALDGSFMAVEP